LELAQVRSASGIDEDVRQIDVTMDDTAPVRRFERLGQLGLKQA
jgi:hypothetical protein